MSKINKDYYMSSDHVDLFNHFRFSYMFMPFEFSLHFIHMSKYVNNVNILSPF